MGDKRRSAHWTHLSLLLAVALFACKQQAAAPDNSQRATTEAVQASSGPTLNGTMPLDVTLPNNIGPTDQVRIRPNFDDFSWRSFVALVWPGDPNSRGNPLNAGDPQALLGAGNAYDSVWSSYRDANDLYVGATANRPVPFDGPATPSPLCGGAGASLVLVKNSKMGDPLSDTQQAFSLPLVDQGGNYIYYQMLFNRDQYDFVRGSDQDAASWLYRKTALFNAEQKAPIGMPQASAKPSVQGAVMIKAAWKQLTPNDDASRYYTRQAQIHDAVTGQCRSAKVGLIGLHIAHKLSDFPQWIWSSFEQVDNVPADGSRCPTAKRTLNNGACTPAVSADGFANAPSGSTPVPNPTPVQVARVNPIPTTPAKVPGQIWPSGAGSTVDLNAAYQALLKGSVWANYQLVITQWPFNAVPQNQFKPPEKQGVYPGDAGGAFPLYGAVNTSMETYFQTQRAARGAGGNSCMQCHYQAGMTDFSWSLKLRSQNPKSSTAQQRGRP